ncbi:hypothetical protein N7535_006520 [Penicillium sp. DV-2018c]|nr:hypothetical protein N7461_007397 [Penicillium sp. DV-2018c]KAJ5567214.1 hypothetical protein N7535_006520 [Penicillium sp. DV-2018c]
MSSITTIGRPLQLLNRAMLWASAVIVMGITSFFISRGPHGQHIIYQEVIAVMSVVFFLPSFFSPFMPQKLSKYVIVNDVVFSYLWLTAFIFAAQDYNWRDCFAHSPPGVGCGRKKANETFIFIAFFCTFFGGILEFALLWDYRTEHGTTPGHHEKIANGGHHSVENGAGHSADTPTAPTATTTTAGGAV